MLCGQRPTSAICCSETPAAPPPLDYGRLDKINLDVKDLDFVDRGNDVGFDHLGPKNGNEPRNARFVENPVDGRRPAVLRR